MLNQRIASFERKMTRDIDAALSKYLSPAQYVLAVNVVWDPGRPTVAGEKTITQEQHKLPGFPIFINSQQCRIATGSTSATVRMEVEALIDESLPNYYERFFRKIIPIIARMDFERGDKLTVQKENFPVLAKFRQMPVLPEEDLMKKAKKALKSEKKAGLTGDEDSKRPDKPKLPGVRPTPEGPARRQESTGRPQPPPQTRRPVQPFPPRAAPAPPPPVLTIEESAQVAFDEGRLKDAERLLKNAFDKAPNNRVRSKYMGMLGSVYFTENDLEKAREAWERAAALDPANSEVHTILNFLENPPNEDSK
ncbi:MAG: tetratricopeptide repeat protein [bacterium]